MEQPRSSQRYVKKIRDDEPRLVADLHRIAVEHPRWGYRRVHWQLGEEGWHVNRKRVCRLWRREGLKVTKNSRFKRAKGSDKNACDKRPATHRNDVWALDFTFDRLENGRQLKWLVVEDEFTREVKLSVGTKFRASDVKAALAALIKERGLPNAIRCDNGSEFVERDLVSWLAWLGVKMLHIAPGSPWQNGCCESFNSKFEDEFLSRNIFEDLRSAVGLTTMFELEYNAYRPHSSLGYVPPSKFAAQLPPPSPLVAPLPSPQAAAARQAR